MSLNHAGCVITASGVFSFFSKVDVTLKYADAINLVASEDRKCSGGQRCC